MSAPASTARPGEARVADAVGVVDAVVIGAGQAGLSAVHHLLRRGAHAPGAPSPIEGAPPGGPGVVVLDAEEGPGGAWRHRWDALTMATVNGIRELPGMPPVEPVPEEPASRAVPDYFARFEQRNPLPILRPVRVTRVEDDRTSPPDPATGLPLLRVHAERTDGGPAPAPLRTRAVLNATGTWTRPFVPAVPGARDFRGRTLHTAEYTRAEDLAGLRVAVVGGGISALGFLLDLEGVAETTWYTRREPVFRDEPFTEEAGRLAVAGVAERVEAGLPVRSVVSATGLAWTPALRAAADRGLLHRHEMFTRILPDGVLEAEGRRRAVDVILWATGFRHELRHLRPLHLHGPAGGIRMQGTAVAADPRIHLLGYGPSASTIGANRAGRAAVTELLVTLAGDAHEKPGGKAPSRE